MNTEFHRLFPERRKSYPFGSRPTASSAQAFTLIELLVASAVSILLVGLLLMALQGISTNYTRTQANIIRQGDAAFALDQIVQDIDGLVIPNVANGEGLRVAPETANVGEITNAVWVTLLSTATDSDNSQPVDFGGATRAVSYRLGHQNPIDGSASDEAYAIYRSIASAEHTFDYASTSTNAQADYWNNLSGLSAPTPSPAPLPALNEKTFVSGNVVGLAVRFLRADTGQWTTPGQDVRIARSGSTVDGVAVPGGFTRAEVAITALSPEGAQRVQDGAMTLKNAIERYGQTSIRQSASF